MPEDPDQRTAALEIEMGVASPGTCNCTVSCMPVKGLMTLSTRHPLIERFRTDPEWRNCSLCNKVLESDTENRGYFLVTMTDFLWGDVDLGSQELFQASPLQLLHLKKFYPKF